MGLGGWLYVGGLVVCTDERYKVGGVWRLDGRRDKIRLNVFVIKDG